MNGRIVVNDDEIRVAYITSSEKLKENLELILQDEIRSGLVDVITSDLYNPRTEYNKLVAAGYNVIIARGGTYNEFKSVEDVVPIVEQRVGSTDILEQIADASASPGQKIYVLIYLATAVGLETIQRVSAIPFEILRYDVIDDLKRSLEEVESNSVVVVNDFAAGLTDRTDINYKFIQYTDSAVKDAVGHAVELAKHMQTVTQHANVLSSILNNIDEGLIIFRPDNTIIETNRRAKQLLKMSDDTLIGNKIDKIIAELPERKNDGTCSIDSQTTFMMKARDKQISCSVYPFELYRGQIRYIITLQDVTKIQSLEQKIRTELNKKGLTAKHNFNDIMTRDETMRGVIASAKNIAGYEGSVLIYGESGTGKELFAQSIHNASERANGPFVAVNCAALTESLLESELFGYVGGSFTGARKEGKAGLFELAHNGTIFLDEINSMPINLQTKILRVIEEQQVMRVGSDYVIPIDVRIIAASNGNLKSDIEEGKFRKDLYYRINTFILVIPPVRVRKSDVVLLFKNYLARHAEEDGGILSPEYIRLEPEFERDLLEHDWPGNVREIRSAALRYDAFNGDNSRGDILRVKPGGNTNSEEIDERHTGPGEAVSVLSYEPEDGSVKVDLKNLSSTIEMLVIESLEGHGMSKSDIARAFGISRQGLYKKMKK